MILMNKFFSKGVYLAPLKGVILKGVQIAPHKVLNTLQSIKYSKSQGFWQNMGYDLCFFQKMFDWEQQVGNCCFKHVYKQQIKHSNAINSVFKLFLDQWCGTAAKNV